MFSPSESFLKARSARVPKNILFGWLIGMNSGFVYEGGATVTGDVWKRWLTERKKGKKKRKKSQSSCSVKFKGIPKEAERDESGSVARLLQRWSRYQLSPCSTRAPGGLSTPHKTRSTLRNDPRHVVLLSLRGKLEFPLKWPLTRREIIMLSGGVRSQGLERGGNITVCAAADTTLHLTLSRAGYRFKMFCI